MSHLYEDSVLARVTVSPAERRAYFEAHIAQYVTHPRARFAAIVRGTRAGADSLPGTWRGGRDLAGAHLQRGERRCGPYARCRNAGTRGAIHTGCRGRGGPTGRRRLRSTGAGPGEGVRPPRPRRRRSANDARADLSGARISPGTTHRVGLRRTEVHAVGTGRPARALDLHAMAVVTAAITIERLAPAGEYVARAIGAVAVGAGLLLIARTAGLG